jgi:CheY-like chemotaxis protein
MDMRMPGLDGYEATRQIKAKLKTRKRTSAPQTVIIALTASSFQEEKAEILAAGCDDFLRKPFRESELFQMMGKHIGVRYIYETLGDAPAGATQDELLLSELPHELLARLEEAIELSDIAQATEIINEIQPIHPEVAERLSQLLNNFEYHKMLEAIKRLDVGVDDGFSEKSVDSGGG